MKIAYKILVNISILLLLVGCSADTSMKGFDVDEPDMDLVSDRIEVSNEAQEISVEISSNHPWRASTKTPWLSFEKANGSGSDALKVTVASNRSQEERVGEITLKVTDSYQRTVTIVQAKGDPIPDGTIHFYVKKDGSDNADGTTWATATSLKVALEEATSGDVIHLAAGIYTPTTTVENGNEADEGEKTFQIAENIKLIGGYPDTPTEGAVSNPSTYQTILSGEMMAKRAYHVVVITAPIEAEREVALEGLFIQKGKTSSATSSVTINGIGYRRNHGGGIIVGGSKVSITNCKITNNESVSHSAGIYVFAGAEIKFRESSINENLGSAAASNGGGIFNDGGTVYLYDCEVIGNQVGGVSGGIYNFGQVGVSKLYAYNTTIANNVVGITGSNSTAAGYYGRTNSEAQLVNCTIYGNAARGDGGGIRLHGGAKLDIISSTITNNTAGNTAAGIRTYDGCPLTITNSIISGNTIPSGNADIEAAYTKSYVLVGNSIYDKDGDEIAGVVFDPSTMFGTLTNNGGYAPTVKLEGATNPAKDYGMTFDGLQLLGINASPAVDEVIITADQTGKSRQNTQVLGACSK